MIKSDSVIGAKKRFDFAYSLHPLRLFDRSKDMSIDFRDIKEGWYRASLPFPPYNLYHN